MTAAFRFYALSEENQEHLRNDVPHCLAILRRCRPLAERLAATQGIYTDLTEDEERLLQDFHEIQQAYEGYQYEGAFDVLCSQVGLRPIDAGLLVGRVFTLYQQREPVVYEAEVYAILEQWLRNEEQ